MQGSEADFQGERRDPRLTSKGVSKTRIQTSVPGRSRAIDTHVDLCLTTRAAMTCGRISTRVEKHTSDINVSIEMRVRTYLASMFVRSMQADWPCCNDSLVRFSTARRSPRSSWLHRRKWGQCSCNAFANVDCECRGYGIIVSCTRHYALTAYGRQTLPDLSEHACSGINIHICQVPIVRDIHTQSVLRE